MIDFKADAILNLYPTVTRVEDKEEVYKAFDAYGNEVSITDWNAVSYVIVNFFLLIILFNFLGTWKLFIGMTPRRSGSTKNISFALWLSAIGNTPTLYACNNNSGVISFNYLMFSLNLTTTSN